MTEKQQAKSLWHYYKNFSFTDKLIFGALVLTLVLMTNLFYFEVQEEIKRTANPEERLAIIVMAALMSFIALYLLNLISQIVIWIIRKFARIQLKGIPTRAEVKTGQTLLKKISIKNALIGFHQNIRAFVLMREENLFVLKEMNCFLLFGVRKEQANVTIMDCDVCIISRTGL